MKTTAELVDQLIHAIASACSEKPMRLGTPHTAPRDKAWKRHRAEVLAAEAGRDVCAVHRCYRAEGDLGEGYCWRHAPDEVAIERASHGDPVPLMTHERHEAIRRMVRAGHGWNLIEERLGVSGETIRRALGREQVAA